MKSFCLIGLGSNLGDRQRALEGAIARLERHPQVKVVARSPWLETAPAGGPSGQSAFLNGAVLVETSLPPETLLDFVQQIEDDLGRRRGEFWGPRTIDLDLLLYDQVALTTPRLVLPHPRMAWRRFVLAPAAQIAASMAHPILNWTIGRMLEHLNTSAWYVAITEVGRPFQAVSVGRGAEKPDISARLLAEEVARRTAVRLLLKAEAQAKFSRPDFACASGLDICRPNNSSRHAWQIELEFLQQRTGELLAERPEWQDPRRPTVSDFWLDQFAAEAQVRLPSEQWEPYRAWWQELRQKVVRPRLIVLLETPADERSDPISRMILEEACQPDQGPVLRLESSDSEAAVREVYAAIEAMR